MPRSLASIRLNTLALVVVATLVAAPPAVRAGDFAHAPASAYATTVSDLVSEALSLLGVSYRRGGDSPDTGLDCSGLVRHVYKEAASLGLPRRAVEISHAGEPIGRDELRPGDLVFFNTLRRAFSHVGIYIGEDRFVHAPGRGRKVRIEDMSLRYWRKRFNGARRLLADAPPQVSAALGPEDNIPGRAQAPSVVDVRALASDFASPRAPSPSAAVLMDAQQPQDPAPSAVDSNQASEQADSNSQQSPYLN